MGREQTKVQLTINVFVSSLFLFPGVVLPTICIRVMRSTTIPIAAQVIDLETNANYACILRAVSLQI